MYICTTADPPVYAKSAEATKAGSLYQYSIRLGLLIRSLCKLISGVPTLASVKPYGVAKVEILDERVHGSRFAGGSSTKCPVAPRTLSRPANPAQLSLVANGMHLRQMVPVNSPLLKKLIRGGPLPVALLTGHFSVVFFLSNSIHSRRPKMKLLKKITPLLLGSSVLANVLDDPVCIVGAGPAGLSTAAELERKGYRTVTFEKQSEVGGKCQAVYAK